MTEEVNGQQPAPDGETATTTEENKIEATETKTDPVTEIKPAEPAKKEEQKWYVDVITGLRHNVRDTKAENETLKAEVAALKAGQKVEQLPDAEINRRAVVIAEQNRFNEKCNQIADKGKETFATFNASLDNLRAVGALGENSNPVFLQTITELPDAHKLLNHLGQNPDEAARINSLPPTKMALELAKIEANLGKTAAVSKAPAPITTVSGNGGGNGDISDPLISMTEFSKIREKQRAERAKR